MTDEQWKKLVQGITGDIIRENHGLDPGSIPVATMAVWHSRRTPQEVTLRLQVDPDLQGDSEASIAKRRALLSDLEPTTFVVGHACPLHNSRIFAIFIGDKTRVYTILSDETGSPAGFLRFTLGETQPHFCVEGMSLGVFQNEVADEWATLSVTEEPEPEPAALPNGGTQP
jgi:hypothetical protein